MSDKIAYVGGATGEMSVVVTARDLVVSFDLLIPNAPLFLLKVPLDTVENKEIAFSDAFDALTQQIIGFLLHQGLDQKLVDELYANIQAAIEDQGTGSNSDLLSSGGSPLLEKIVELEPLDVFEVRFKIPDGFSEAIHTKVVTAAVIHRDPPASHLPHNFQTQRPSKVQQAGPSLKNLIMKFKPQQNKALSGPIFVLVYDVNGRPVGVRQLKGPGWSGIGGKMAGDRVYIPLTPGPALFKRPDPPIPPPEKPSRDFVRQEALELLSYLKNFGEARMRQSNTGSFYILFQGPATHLEKKLRVSDHPKPNYADPELARERHSDFDVDPRPGHTIEDAKSWIKTASKDVVEIPNFRGGRDEVTILIDPNPAQVSRLCREYGVARAFVWADGSHVVAWDAYVALHGQLRDYLQLHGIPHLDGAIPVSLTSGRDVVVTDNSKNSKWYHNPEVAPILKASPALRRALGGVPTISYFDEDIVGPWDKLPDPNHAGARA